MHPLFGTIAISVIASAVAFANGSDKAVRLDKIRDFPPIYQKAVEVVRNELFKHKEDPKEFYAEFKIIDGGNFLFQVWPKHEWLSKDSGEIRDGSAGGRTITIDGKTFEISALFYWQ